MDTQRKIIHIAVVTLVLLMILLFLSCLIIRNRACGVHLWKIVRLGIFKVIWAKTQLNRIELAWVFNSIIFLESRTYYRQNTQKMCGIVSRPMAV